MPLNTDTIRAGASGATVGASFYPTTIDQSLRFNNNDSAYLSLSPAQTGDSNKTFTFSCWVKRCAVGTEHVLFSAGANASSATGIVYFYFSSSDTLSWYTQMNGSANAHYITSVKYRDTSAWYHVVLVEVSATSHKIYVNGVEQDYATTTAGSDQSSAVGTTEIHTIGRRSWTASSYLNGYMAEVNFLDNITVGETNGYLDEFGELKNGIWIPKAYTGSYGTNGFRLTFADSSNIGNDTANANDFTANNFTAVDVVPDSPTNNFSTINTLHMGPSYSATTISEGALSLKHSNLAHASAIATTVLPKTGKWYWETLNNSNATSGTNTVGVVVSTYNNSNALSGAGNPFWANGFGIYGNNGGNFGTAPSVTWDTTGSATTFTANDIIGVAYDADNKDVEWYKNGVKIDYNVTNFDDDGKDLIPASSAYGNPANSGIVFNFGQDSSFAGGKTSGSANASDDNGIGDFYYSVPSGFLALCASNIPEPTIGPNSTTQASDNFNISLYQGNETAGNTGSGLGFQPDWLMFKNRDSTDYWRVYDSTRGTEKSLAPNDNDAEVPSDGGVTSFTSPADDGFTMGATSYVNRNGDDYVAWAWKANGGTTSTISADTYSSGVPSVASTVQANTDAGFSIVTFPANGTNGTVVGHGLEKAPKMIITKQRPAISSWYIYHNGIGKNAWVRWNNPNTEGERTSGSTTIWGNVTPDENTFTIGNYDTGYNNGGANDVVAYCFAEIENYSKFGTFEGNGDSTGTFINLGFRPRFFMMFLVSTASLHLWFVYDTKRGASNQPINPEVYFSDQSYDAESAFVFADFVSNGIKIRTGNSARNPSGGEFIYMAFAENPFKYANAR